MKPCEREHIGGPGVRVGRGCIHAGPLGLAVLLGAATAAVSLSNPHMPSWVAIPLGLLWPVVSIVGQWLSP